MNGYTMVKDQDIKVIKKMLPSIVINFDNPLAIQGEVKITKVRKYKHNYIVGYHTYTCDVEFKGIINYPNKKHYGTEFYNKTMRGNKIRLNKRFKREALKSIVGELKIFGDTDVNKLEITKINWV
jgi:hypothetical protein